jgi:transposase
MEDVLELYAEEYNPTYPVVCFDEQSKQLVSEVRTPLPVQPGHPQRYDYEYRREGTANIFMMVQPLGGWRHVSVTERRTTQDFARCMKALVDEYVPNAQRIRVVLDNLNTHRIASLYATFGPEEARRIARKLEFHYTPKHGSWLNQAEIELSILTSQCLNQRIPSIHHLRAKVRVWKKRRNEANAKIQWRFTAKDARKKLRRLYPSRS